MVVLIPVEQLGTAGGWLWSALNSNFGTSLLGAGAGAVAGAWAAQEISDRRALIKRQIEELRSTNSTVSATIIIVNTYSAMKRQHILPMKTEYDKAAKKLHQLHKKANKGTLPPGTTFHFTADFESLEAPHTPLEELGRLLSEKIGATPQHLAMYYLLAQSARQLSKSLHQRNAFIEWMRTQGPRTDQGKAEVYFGIRQSNGNTDRRYSSIMEAIAHQTDACLVFGKALAEDLVAHGRAIAKAKRKGMPTPANCDFRKLEELKLLPPSADYEDLLARVRGQRPPATD